MLFSGGPAGREKVLFSGGPAGREKVAFSGGPAGRETVLFSGGPAGREKVALSGLAVDMRGGKGTFSGGHAPYTRSTWVSTMLLLCPLFISHATLLTISLTDSRRPLTAPRSPPSA